MMSTSLKLTFDQYDAMVTKGAFDDLTQKIELIDGEIQAMNPAGPVHDHIIEFLTHWSVKNTDYNQIRVRIQSGLSLPAQNSRPEPDVLWVRADHPRDRHPVDEDVLLLIEVADSSLETDRQTKAKLYARARIVEYWIVNIADESVLVYRDPGENGYESISTARVGERIMPLFEPAAALDLGELFGRQ